MLAQLALHIDCRLKAGTGRASSFLRMPTQPEKLFAPSLPPFLANHCEHLVVKIESTDLPCNNLSNNFAKDCQFVWMFCQRLGSVVLNVLSWLSSNTRWSLHLGLNVLSLTSLFAISIIVCNQYHCLLFNVGKSMTKHDPWGCSQAKQAIQTTRFKSPPSAHIIRHVIQLQSSRAHSLWSKPSEGTGFQTERLTEKTEAAAQTSHWQHRHVERNVTDNDSAFDSKT